MAGNEVCVYMDEALGRYAFGGDHPFGPLRLPAFVTEARRRPWFDHVCRCQAVMATPKEVARFHRGFYIDRVRRVSRLGAGWLDAGDTPAFAGAFEAALTVVGTVLDAVTRIMDGRCRRAFVPIAGLHHARPDSAAGFCVFNDCGVAIATLLKVHRLGRIAYVDIDAHHGDGVFYAFEDDPRVIIADVHEDGRFLYPGSGFAEETGVGKAAGSKLNLPMPPGATDTDFFTAWARVEAFVRDFKPEFILMQCGADCLAGDPITHLHYTPAVHRHAAASLVGLAEACCGGRLLAVGGGGYKLDNLAEAWCSVVDALVGD